MKVYANTINICGGNVIASNSWQHSIVLGDKWVNKDQATLEEDLCNNNNDVDSAN